MSEILIVGIAVSTALILGAFMYISQLLTIVLMNAFYGVKNSFTRFISRSYEDYSC